MVRSAIILLLLGGCIAQIPSEMHTVCVRYVDEDGYLRGRAALFNSRGRDRALRGFSVAGRCPAGAQGPSRRIMVCLVGSSRCGHDRTTNVWEDQLDRYFEKYPGSYRGECISECSQHKDDC